MFFAYSEASLGRAKYEGGSQEHVHPANNGMEVTELRVFIYTLLRIIDKFEMSTLFGSGALSLCGPGPVGKEVYFHRRLLRLVLPEVFSELAN